MRIAETKRSPGYKVDASEFVTDEPLRDSAKRPLPTAKFALEFDIPDSQFKLAEQVLAEIEIAESTKLIAADIHYVEVP